MVRKRSGRHEAFNPDKLLDKLRTGTDLTTLLTKQFHGPTAEAMEGKES